MKKFLKALAWVGLILSVVGAILISAVARIPNSWLVVTGMVFAISLWGVSRKRKAVVIDPEEEETDENEPWDWPLIIAWSLVAIAAIATILIGIFFSWWFLLPLTALFGALIWVSSLLGWARIWDFIFIGVIVILLIWFGVFLIQKTVAVNANVNGDLNVGGNLNVGGDANISGNANAEGDANVGGNANVGGDATIGGDAMVGDDLMVNGDAAVNNNLIVNGDSTIKGNQTVEGDQNVQGDLNVGGDINDVPPTTTTPPETEPSTPVHTHNYSKKETAPTCTEKGYTTYTCSCGHSYVDNYVDALGHNYKSEVVAPTTTAKGYTKHTCTRCGHSYEDNYTDMLPTPVAPSFTLLESGNGYWVVKFEGMVSSDIVLDNASKGRVELQSANTLKVVKTYEGTCYFSLTDAASGEVIYLF